MFNEGTTLSGEWNVRLGVSGVHRMYMSAPGSESLYNFACADLGSVKGPMARGNKLNEEAPFGPPTTTDRFALKCSCLKWKKILAKPPKN